MNKTIIAAIFLLVLTSTLSSFSFAQVITRLPTSEKIVALTFDACERKTPSYFDRKILDFLIREKIPATLFLSGKFALRNGVEIRDLAKLSFIEIENHSLNHHQNMEKLKEIEVKNEVLKNEEIIFGLTNKRPKFFRFPAGNYHESSLKIVESLGYRVVHWTFVSGDPDKSMTSSKLKAWVLRKTKPGSILIFHINGRGYSTGEALPEIVQELKNRGYKFVKLEESLKLD